MSNPTEAGQIPRWTQYTAPALSFAAVVVASYLTVTHYSDPAALACPDTGVVNCTLVTTSSWSVFLGVPVAVLGLGVVAGHAGPDRALELADRVGRARPGEVGRFGCRCRCRALPGLRRTLPDRRHLPVVHGGPRAHGLPLRSSPGRPCRGAPGSSGTREAPGAIPPPKVEAFAPGGPWLHAAQ